MSPEHSPCSGNGRCRQLIAQKAVEPLSTDEVLAYKIEVFEAVDRERGFDVRTPRIPGLQYRDLAEI